MTQLTAVLFPVTGEPTTVTLDEGADSYLWIKSMLDGGYLETFATPLNVSIYIDEEGKLKHLPVNETVPAVFSTYLMPGDVLVGPVVILGPTDDEGYDTPITLDQLKGML